jgi:hypothetical protein
MPSVPVRLILARGSAADASGTEAEADELLAEHCKRVETPNVNMMQLYQKSNNIFSSALSLLISFEILLRSSCPLIASHVARAFAWITSCCSTCFLAGASMCASSMLWKV